MSDPFQSNSEGLDSPPLHAFAITGSDTVDLTVATRAIYVGVGGDIKVNMVGGETVTFTGVPQGSWFPCRAARVWATGTTATTLIGGY